MSAGEFLILCNIINVRKTVFYDYFLGEIEHKKSQLLNKRKTRAPPEKQQKFQNISSIPSEYWDILNPGLNSHIFPKSNTYEIFASFQNLKRNAIKTCKNRQFDMKRRHHVLSQIDHALDQVNHIRPAPTKLPELKQFLIDNNLIVTKSDKTDVAVIMPSNEYYSGIHKTLKDKAYTRLNGSKQNSERDQIQKSILKNCRHQKEENGVPIFKEDGKPEMSKYISNAEYAKISTNHKGRERSVLSLQKTHKPLENGFFKKTTNSK